MEHARIGMFGLTGLYERDGNIWLLCLYGASFGFGLTGLYERDGNKSLDMDFMALVRVWIDRTL